MKPSISVGIDPGLNGGIALLQNKTDVIFCSKLPTIVLPNGKRELKTYEIYTKLKIYEDYISDLVIEQVSAMPKQGVTSMFTFGQVFGELLSLVKIFGPCLKISRPTARVWKQKVFGYSTADKQASIEYVKSRWPKLSLKATSKSIKDHDGIADAICLAVYGTID